MGLGVLGYQAWRGGANAYLIGCNSGLCQDFCENKKLRKIKGLVKVSLRGRNNSVKTFWQVVQVYAIGIMLCNMCMRDMRGATCIMRECVSSCYVWHICGGLCECCHGRMKLSDTKKCHYLCNLREFRTTWSIYLRSPVLLRDWHRICIWLI